MADEAVEGFEAERELAVRERAFGSEAALAEPFEVFGASVLEV